MSYEEDIAIDPNALDEECFRQPALCHKYAKDFMEAQEEYKSVKSRLTLDIKLHPENYFEGKDRVTDTMLEALLYSQKEYVDAKKKRDTLKFALEHISKQKKFGIQHAIDLYKIEYFSTIREPSQEVPSGKRMILEKEVSNLRENLKKETRRRRRETKEK